MVRFQSISLWRGRRLRWLRSSAPVTAERMGSSSFFSSSSTTLRTTMRAVSLVLAGITPDKAIRLATRCTSAWALSSISGCSSISRTSRRSSASRCITCTTCVGKYLRMSPSQRATLGAEPPRPPRRSVGLPRPLLPSAS